MSYHFNFVTDDGQSKVLFSPMASFFKLAKIFEANKRLKNCWRTKTLAYFSPAKIDE
jgi:hypothetical protein